MEGSNMKKEEKGEEKEERDKNLEGRNCESVKMRWRV